MTVGHFTIGMLARETNTKVETIRFYERSGLLPAPGRTNGNYRAYELVHLNRLSFIRRLRELGFPLEQVRAMLDLADDRTRSCAAVDAMVQQHLVQVDEKVAALGALRHELQRMVQMCGTGTVAECRIIESLSPRGAGTLRN